MFQAVTKFFPVNIFFFGPHSPDPPVLIRVFVSFIVDDVAIFCFDVVGAEIYKLHISTLRPLSSTFAEHRQWQSVSDFQSVFSKYSLWINLNERTHADLSDWTSLAPFTREEEKGANSRLT